MKRANGKITPEQLEQTNILTPQMVSQMLHIGIKKRKALKPGNPVFTGFLHADVQNRAGDPRNTNAVVTNIFLLLILCALEASL